MQLNIWQHIKALSQTNGFQGKFFASIKRNIEKKRILSRLNESTGTHCNTGMDLIGAGLLI